jgi:hypothetical protein
VNDPSLRFCRKCAQPLGRAAVAPRTPDRPPGASDLASERAARSAYRRSLPIRYRVIRIGSAVAATALVIAFVAAAGRDPVGWTRRQIYAVRGTLVPVQVANASSDGSTAQGFSAEGAVDGNTSTAWGITMTSVGSNSLTCDVSPGGTALLLTIAGTNPVTVRALEVRSGLSDPGGKLQFRPAMLELRAAGGWCERVRLRNTAAAQRVKISAHAMTGLRVSIVGAYPPPTGGQDVAAITEIQLLARPK